MDIDKLVKYIDRSKKYELYRDAARMYIKCDDYENAEKYYLYCDYYNITKVYEEIGDFYERYRLDYESAENYYLISLHFDATVSVIKKLIKLYLITGDDKVVNMYKKLKMCGDNSSYYKIAEYYYAKQMYSDAINYYEKAFHYEDKKALAIKLGTIYEEYNKDYNKAFYWYNVATGNNIKYGYYKIANLYKNYINNLRYEEHYYLIAIENGYDFNFDLAYFYHVKKYNFTNAQHFYLAAYNNPMALNNLGVLYQNTNIQNKYEIAIYYHTIAISFRCAFSYFNIALCYLYLKMHKTAIYYLQESVKQNNCKNSVKLLAMIYAFILNNIELALPYFLQDKNDDIVIFNLASYYLKANNIVLAKEYFSISAKNKNVKALYNLGKIYSEHYNNMNLGIDYYLEAIKLDHVKSMHNLGIVFDKLKKYDLAIKYYLMAINHGNYETYIRLAYLSHKQNNNTLAEFYYNQYLIKN